MCDDDDTDMSSGVHLSVQGTLPNWTSRGVAGPATQGSAKLDWYFSQCPVILAMAGIDWQHLQALLPVPVEAPSGTLPILV